MATDAETELLGVLDAMGIPYEIFRHEPVKSVQEALDAEKTCGLDHIVGARTKNLFFTDKKKLKRWLFTASVDSKFELKKLGQVIRAQDLKFASDLTEVLRLEPGSVTPFGILNDGEMRVISVVDEAVLIAERALVHPMHNLATISVPAAGLLEFLAARGHEPIVVRFP
ncbi:YbaK/aminoacyl-tRNA synthetase-associated domain-containing protein, partial [Pavlovales sp. CCMP2436]